MSVRLQDLFDLLSLLFSLSALGFLLFRPPLSLPRLSRGALLLLLAGIAFVNLGNTLETFRITPLVDTFSEPVKDVEPLLWLLFFASLVTGRKRTEEDLERERLQLLLESTEDLILVLDREGRYRYFNGPARYGFRPLEVVGLTPYHLHPREVADLFMERLRKVTTSGERMTFETRMRVGEETLWFSDQFSPLRDGAGKVVGAAVICRNITSLKQAEERLRASLEEKDLLLREVHRRVKNNLQVIASLLDLQVAQSGDPGSVSPLRETRTRLQAMARVHERLLLTHEAGAVAFGPFVKGMLADQAVWQGKSQPPVVLRDELEGITLPTDTVIALCLILNELLSNACRHAFPPGRPPRALSDAIEVTLRREGATLVLGFADNGIGLPPGVDLQHSRTMGMGLVRALVAGVGGEVAVERNGGTRYTLRVPLQ